MVSNYFFGWPPLLPSYEEQQRRKIEARREEAARWDSFQEVLSELARSRKMLEGELDSNRVSRTTSELDPTAWRDNSYLLSAPEFEEKRKVVEDAYRLIEEIEKQEWERFEQVDQADLAADSAWWTLTDREKQDREDAVRALRKAWLEVADVQMEEESKRWKKWWQVWK